MGFFVEPLGSRDNPTWANFGKQNPPPQPVCTFKTSPCVPATRPHVVTHVDVLPVVACTHGDVLNAHTGVFQRGHPTHHTTTHYIAHTHHNHNDNHSHTQQRQRQASIPSVPISCVFAPFAIDPSEQPVTGAAQRRKQRRLRSWWRHEQQSIAAALATSLHQSSRGQMARAGEEESKLNYTAAVRKTPPPQLVLFSLYDEEPGGRRPASLAEPPGPQERVRAHARDVRARPVSRCSCVADG